MRSVREGIFKARIEIYESTNGRLEWKSKRDTQESRAGHSIMKDWVDEMLKALNNERTCKRKMDKIRESKALLFHVQVCVVEQLKV